MVAKFLYHNLATKDPQCYRKFCSPSTFIKKHRETNKLLRISMTRVLPIRIAKGISRMKTKRGPKMKTVQQA